MDTNKRSLIKRIMAVVLSAFLFVTYMPGLAYAVEGLPEGEEPSAVEPVQSAGPESEVEGEVVIPDEKLAGEDELLMSFIESRAQEALGGAEGAEGDDAETPNELLYRELRSLVEDVADGSIDTPQTKVYPSDLTGTDFTYSPEDLDVSRIFVRDEEGDLILDGDGNAQIAEEAEEAAWQAYCEDFDYYSTGVVNDLLKDLPFDFYWYDKTTGFLEQPSYIPSAEIDGNGNETITITPEITFTFAVAKAYRGSNAPEEIEYSEYDEQTDTWEDKKFYLYTTNSGKITAANNAAANAADVVSAAEDLSNYEKLVRYKDEICGMTSYDDVAGDLTNEVDYGDPWQLIYVFDDDASTGVVCEGYSKAFQFLCMLTDSFEGEIDCYSVTGNMTGGTGEGSHMWNILHMDDDRNYIADITNSDDDGAGVAGDDDPDGSYLFLNGYAEGNDEDGYYRYSCGDSSVGYVYDPETTELYSAEELTMSESSYGGPEEDEDEELSIEMEVGKTNVLINELLEFCIDTEGADEIRIYLDYNESEGAINKPDIINDESDSITEMDEMLYYEEKGTYVLRAEAVRFSSSEEVEDEIAFAEETISVTELGDTGNVIITRVNDKNSFNTGVEVTRGDELIIECSGGAYANHFFAQIKNNDGSMLGWFGHTEDNTIRFSTIGIAPGTYTVQAGANGPGYTTSFSDSFTLTVKDIVIPEGEDMYFSLSKDRINTMEMFDYNAYCPGAEEIVVTYGLDGDFDDSARGDSISGWFGYRYSGAYTVKATGYAYDEEDNPVVVGSAEKTVTVVAPHGALEFSMPEFPDYIMAGEDQSIADLSFTIQKPNNAEEFYVSVEDYYNDESLFEDDSDNRPIEVTVSGEDIAPDAIIKIRAEAWAEGYEYAEEEVLIPVVGPVSDDLEISTDADVAPKTILVNQPVNIDVTSGSEVADIWLYDGYEYHWCPPDAYVGNVLSEEYRFWRPGTQVVFARVLFEGADEDEWVTTEPLVFNVKSNGSTGNFSVSDVKVENESVADFSKGVTITRGDNIQIICTEAQNANEYWLDVDQYDQGNWGETDFHPNSGSPAVAFNTLGLEPGQYRIRVNAGGPGYENAEADNQLILTVKKVDVPAGKVLFRLSDNALGDTPLNTGEDFSFGAYCPDASGFEVHMNYDGDRGWTREFWGENSFSDMHSYSRSGTYKLVAVAYGPDGEKVGTSDPVTVQVEAEHNSEIALSIPDLPSYLLAGEGALNFEIDMPDHADGMRAEVGYEDEDDKLFEKEVHNGSLTVSVPSDRIQYGGIIRINVDAWGYGYEEGHEEIKIPVMDAISDDVTVTPSKSTVRANEDVEYTVNYTGSDAIGWMVVFNGRDYREVETDPETGKLISHENYGEAGTYTVFARIHFESGEEVTSEPITITVTKKGETGRFRVTGFNGEEVGSDPVEAAQGTLVPVTYTEAANADHYWIDVDRPDENGNWQWVGHYADTDKLTAHLGTGDFEPGEYRLTVKASALDYETAEADNTVLFNITESQLPPGGMSLSVSDNTLLTNEDFSYTAYCPSADSIRVYPDYDGNKGWNRDDRTGNESYGSSGTYRLTAVGYKDGEEIEGATASVNMTVTAPNGNLVVEIPEGLPASITEGSTPSISFTAAKPKNASGLKVEARVETENTSERIYEKNTEEDSLSVNLDTSGVAEGERIIIEIGAWGLGYEYSNQRIEIPVVPSASDLVTLTAAQTNALSNEEIEFTVAPANESVEITEAVFVGGHSFDDPKQNEDGSFTQNISFERAGNYAVYATVSLNGYSTQFATNVINVTVTSSGRLALIMPELPSQICRGDELSFTLSMPEHGHSIGAYVWHGDDMEDETARLFDRWTEDESMTVTVPAEDLQNLDAVHVEIKGWGYGYDFNNAIVDIPIADHDFTHKDAVPATCETNGMAEHYECSACHRLFIMEDDEYIEITDEDLIIPAEHNYGDLIAEEPATCIKDGMAAHYECSECHKLFVKEGDAYVEKTAEELKLTVDHTYGDIIPEVAADCDTDGVAAHYECSVCHKLFVMDGGAYVEKTAEELKIPAGHTIEAHAQKDPTYDQTGNEACYECTVCHKFFSDAEGRNEISEPVIKSLKDQAADAKADADAKKAIADEAAKTPGDAAIAAAQASEDAARIAAEKAQAAADAAASDPSVSAEDKNAAAQAARDAAQAYEDAKAATQKAKDDKAAADAASQPAVTPPAAPAEILDLPAVKITKPASAKKKLTVKWKKVSKKNLKKISGIQIQVATDPGFTNIVKTATAGKKKTSKKIGGLQPKTKYYVRIRAYGAANHYSVWKSKSGKTK